MKKAAKITVAALSAAARENEPFHCTREKAKRRRRHRKAK